MTSLNPALALVGRLLLAFIFVLSGWSKLTGYAGTAQYMDSAGVPSILLPAAIAVELIGGLLIAVGFQTRISALALAGFTVVAALLFHFDPSDQMQMISFNKNLAIAGGFLVLAAHGAGLWSVDGRRGRA